MKTLRTVGHGTASAEEFADLLTGAGITELVDVRRFPGSRRHPQFGSDAMAAWLPEANIGYRHIESLGGRRRLAADSVNIGLRNEQFRAYGDYMATDEFLDGVAELVRIDGSVAVMCAESVWWRCHRRLLADHLVLVAGVDVEHLFHDRRLTTHQPTSEARAVEGHVVYDVGVDRELLVDEPDRHVGGTPGVRADL